MCVCVCTKKTIPRLWFLYEGRLHPSQPAYSNLNDNGGEKKSQHGPEKETDWTRDGDLGKPNHRSLRMRHKHRLVKVFYRYRRDERRDERRESCNLN